MRVMVMIKANEASEAGQLPNTEVIASMHAYNESLMKAGILLDGDGLKPSSQGRRISNRGGKPHVTDGPFAETKELIAGFWMIQVRSREKAIEWAKRVRLRLPPERLHWFSAEGKQLKGWTRPERTL